MEKDPLRSRRIAMWSGPRNISTALMRSWENRADTVVCDEPLYAHYLKETSLLHPGREEVLNSQENDWKVVTANLTGNVPDGRRFFYQKHMTHHLLPQIDRGWILLLTNVLLIRDPDEMLTSLIQVTPDPVIADTGLPQQSELFAFLERSHGAPPLVIDSRDVLENPEGLLRALCGALDVPFDPAMLSWPEGPRETDGVWAKYWYDSVNSSTGFAPYRAKTDQVPDRLQPLLENCRVYYRRLHPYRLRSC